MKFLFKLFVSVFLLLISIHLKSQNCSYTVTNNYSVALDTDIVFKTIVYYNVQTLKYDTMDLKMDIIKPTGDNNTQRPIVVYFHGMNESYKYSQLHVKRMVDVMVKERGFVLASVDYKIWALPYVESTPSNCGNLLFLLNGIYSSYDNLEAQRADYRVTQDANDAIKFITQRAATDSACTNLCFIAGFSAGGLVASSAVFMSQAEKPYAAGNIAPANYTNLFGTALTPTVSFPRQDLGSVYGSSNSSLPSIKGLMLFNSGMHNKNLIQQNEAPLFMYHSLNDPNIPADSSSPACFTDSKIYGQNILKSQALNNGYQLNQNLVLLNGNTNHDFYNTQIRPAADFMNSQINQLQCLCDNTTSIFQKNEPEELNIYANENKIIINGSLLNNQNTTIMVYDILGNIVYNETIHYNSHYQFNITKSTGIYIVQINSKNHFQNKKIQLINH